MLDLFSEIDRLLRPEVTKIKLVFPSSNCYHALIFLHNYVSGVIILLDTKIKIKSFAQRSYLMLLGWSHKFPAF